MPNFPGIVIVVIGGTVVGTEVDFLILVCTDEETTAECYIDINVYW